MREHKEILFLGNGDHSMAQVLKLMDRVRAAFNTSSDIQQAKITYIEYGMMRQEVIDVVADLACALLGKNEHIEKVLDQRRLKV